MLNFPKNFLWGTSTSAYQIEGAVAEDGRGESIWDSFAHLPGRIRDNDNGDVACDHYHRFEDDVRLMKTLGYNAYRFSIAWPRIFPEGRGTLNTRGLDFYSRLVDALLENDITPNATLYHWDLPSALEGGWGSRATAQAFAEYADAVTRRLGDRVGMWATINEPWCSSILGYQKGEHAPGIRDTATALRAAHHLLLAHGLAMPVIRANSPKADAGIVLNLVPTTPLTGSAADYEAFRFHDGFFNRWFLDPVFGRSYPADTVADYVKMGWLASDRPDFIQPDDMRLIAAPLDFLGINYYSRAVVAAVPGREMETGVIRFWQAPRETLTDMNWEVCADSLYRELVRVYYQYLPKKMQVSENGAAYQDAPDAQGRIRDTRRIEYLDAHLRAAHRAIEAGVPLNGFFVWSFMDNFEWAHGYAMRFGLVQTDYATQRRTPRESAYWYGDVARRNGLE